MIFGTKTSEMPVSQTSLNSLNCQSFMIQYHQENKKRYHKITSKFSKIRDKYGKSHFQLPVFNKGKGKLMSGFKSKWQQENLEGCRDFQDQGKQQNLEGSSAISHKILVAKPRLSFCYICKAKFHDYLKHIGSKFHTQNAQESEINQEIRKIISQNFIQPTKSEKQAGAKIMRNKKRASQQISSSSHP